MLHHIVSEGTVGGAQTNVQLAFQNRQDTVLMDFKMPTKDSKMDTNVKFKLAMAIQDLKMDSQDVI